MGAGGEAAVVVAGGADSEVEEPAAVESSHPYPMMELVMEHPAEVVTGELVTLDLWLVNGGDERVVVPIAGRRQRGFAVRSDRGVLIWPTGPQVILLVLSSAPSSRVKRCSMTGYSGWQGARTVIRSRLATTGLLPTLVEA